MQSLLLILLQRLLLPAPPLFGMISPQADWWLCLPGQLIGSKTYYAASKDLVTNCYSLVRTAVTINIILHPAAPIGVNATECEKSPLQTLTATAIVPPGQTVKWYTAASGGLPIPTPTLHAVTTATYYAEADNGVCASLTRTAVTMQINPAPPPPVSIGDKTICETTPATVLKADDQVGAQGLGITVSWYPSASGGTKVTNAILGSVGTITYYAEAVNVATSCVSLSRSAPVKLTINAKPAKPVSLGDVTECEKSPMQTLIAKATTSDGSSINWFTTNVGGLPVVSPTLNAAGTIKYYAESYNANCVNPDRTGTAVVTLTINPAPAPPVVTNPLPKCDDGIPITASASVPLGMDVLWFASATGGSPISPAPMLSGPGKVTYYAEARNTLTDCRSAARTPQTLEIIAVPQSTISNGDIIQCATSPVQTLTASATSPDGATVLYYRTATGGAPVTPTLNVVGSITYYAEADNGSCKSVLPRTPILLQINPVPQPPKSKGTLTLCQDSPLVPVDMLTRVIPAGSGVQWFTVPTGGEPLDHNPSVIDPGTTTYYAGSVDLVTGCQSITRTAVTVVINPQPLNPVSAGDVTDCVQNPVQVLRAAVLTPVDGATIVWYTSATGNTAVASPILNRIGSISYWAEAKLGTCVSANRAMVTLTINPVPVAPAIGSSGNHLTACASASGLDANTAINIAPGTTIKWYDSATNGLEVSPIQITPGDRTLYAEANYATGCKSPARTKVMLTVNPNPADPVAINLTACADAPPQTLTANVVTPPAGVTITWYDAPTGGSIVASPTWSQIGTKSYYASSLFDVATVQTTMRKLDVSADEPSIRFSISISISIF